MTKLKCVIVLAALASTAALAAADRPPQDLHQVGDHWTAWEPPAPPSFPEGATVYTIVRGDTLWDLAQRFYGDPYLWPQLWEQNRYILDAHWIYPGDPLLVDVEVTTADEYQKTAEKGGAPAEGGKAAPPAAEEPFRGVLTADQAAGAPVPLGAESDIYCSGFIGAPDLDFPYELIGSEHGALTPSLEGVAGKEDTGYYGDIETVRYDLATGDVVYLHGGQAAGLAPGDVLSAVEPEEIVHHPHHRDRILGRYYQYVARVKVLSVQDDTAIGEIDETCSPVHVGDRLRKFQAQPVPLGRRTRMRPVNLPASAASLEDAPAIVRTQDSVVSLGQGSIVFIDRGGADDVLPGDLFTIYRRNKPGLPPVVIGELAVLSVEDHTAVARILESRYTVYVGDLLEAKR